MVRSLLVNGGHGRSVEAPRRQLSASVAALIASWLRETRPDRPDGPLRFSHLPYVTISTRSRCLRVTFSLLRPARALPPPASACLRLPPPCTNTASGPQHRLLRSTRAPWSYNSRFSTGSAILPRPNQRFHRLVGDADRAMLTREACPVTMIRRWPIRRWPIRRWRHQRPS